MGPMRGRAAREAGDGAMMRVFVGLALPDEVVRTLTAAQAGLPAGRPVPPENLHLTIAFLGERPEPVVEDLHAALSRIGAPPVGLSLRGTGLFGGARPRILYADVAEAPGLGHLRRKVLTAAREAGIDTPRERFQPHVTLARLPRELPVEDVQRLEAFAVRRMDLAAGPVTIRAFALFESHLKGDGALYEVLAEYPLERGAES
jgi:2'-5' RNA ligase